MTQTKRPRGISIETFLRLFAVTPSSSRRGVLAATGKGLGASTFMRPPMYLPVKVVASRSSSGVPSNTIWPPRSPGPGPTSMTRSAAIITCGSCSTTTKVLPASRKRCITSTTRWMSRGCRPIEGSSSTKSVLTSDVPSAVVRLMRCTSPPESVRLWRSSVRYPKPTSHKNFRRARTSVSTRSMAASSPPSNFRVSANARS